VGRRGGGQTHLGDPNSGDDRLQTLGHHGEGERERWEREREVTAREKSNERKRLGGGGRAGRTGPDRVTPRVKTHDTHNH
jgi:hypothetical protein